MSIFLEFMAFYLFWLFAVLVVIHRSFKKVKREILIDVNKKLYQDRQIRRGNVGTVSRIDSGRDSSASGS